MRNAKPSTKRPRDTATTADLAPGALLTDCQRLDWLRLIRSENVGPITFRRLINRYGSAALALDALPDLARTGGLKRPLRIAASDAVDAEFAAARRIGTRLVAMGEADYPPLLAQIETAPPLIYLRGAAPVSWAKPIAMVGSRNASAAGLQLTRLLASDLGRDGWLIVSGLARGIDAAAHSASLETGTIAVMAGGLDRAYPTENTALFERIGEVGRLISEMPPGYQARAQDFPRRNRIIAGIAWGTIVVEAAERSGSLVTARLAAEFGREVMAVPGHPLDPRAGGTLQLLRDGATLVARAADVDFALSPQLRPGLFTGQAFTDWRGDEDSDAPEAAEAPDAAPDDGARAAVLGLLGPAPIEIDALISVSGLSAAVVQVALLELDLAGRIEHQPGHRVALLPPVGPE